MKDVCLLPQDSRAVRFAYRETPFFNHRMEVNGQFNIDFSTAISAVLFLLYHFSGKKRRLFVLEILRGDFGHHEQRS